PLSPRGRGVRGEGAGRETTSKHPSPPAPLPQGAGGQGAAERQLPAPATAPDSPADFPRRGTPGYVPRAGQDAFGAKRQQRGWLRVCREPLDARPGVLAERRVPRSHPELLGLLAAPLVAGGCQLKPLHRALLLSSAYGEARLDGPDGRRRDPDIRLLWRMNRR